MDTLQVLQDKVYDLYDKYIYARDELSDPRVKDWLLMQSYYPTLMLTAAYLFLVWIGPKIMQNKEPFQLRFVLFVYNMGLVILNFHIFYELIEATYLAGYSYSCQQVVYSNDPQELRIASALWWYYFSKLLEFWDTFFFILRKKNNQVSFLHVYHHASMFPIWWIGVKWVAGGQSYFGAMINSFIHVIMYTYYGIAVLGPQFQKYLWWKKYLTRIQLVQFVAGMIHAAQSLIIGCPFPLWMQWALILYGGSILGLFLNFYFHAYIKSQRDKSTAKTANGHVANGDAGKHYSNGVTATGDHSKKKSKAKGTVESKKSK